MNDKIAWLEELLALEPNSKQFFPLAQSYLLADRAEDAVRALQKGLAFHPKHLDARLLLIRCLSQLKNRNAAKKETEQLAATLSTCPVFWELWAEQSREAGRQDMAVTLRLLEKFLNGDAIQWGQILEQGLTAVTLSKAESTPALQIDDQGQEAARKVAPGDIAPLIQDQVAGDDQQVALVEPSLVGTDSHETTDTVAPSDDTAEQAATEHEPEPAGAPASRIQARISLPRPEDIPGYASLAASAPSALHERLSKGVVEDESTPVDVPESREKLSESERNYYETKTYADLLANQGEIQEALNVYGKLLRASTDDAKRRDLKKRIRQLKEAGQKIQTQPGSQQAGEDHAPVPDKHKTMTDDEQAPTAPVTNKTTVVQTLTRLAERLETRARS